MAAVLLSTLTASETVLACSPRHVYSADELVHEATAIYRAEAVEYGDVLPEDDSHWNPMRSQVRFSVRDVLKGPTETTLQFRGEINDTPDPNSGAPPHDFVRIGGRHGSCFANYYRVGQEYLLFLKDGELYWAPLAAANEEVAGPDDRWVRWVKATLDGSCTSDPTTTQHSLEALVGGRSGYTIDVERRSAGLDSGEDANPRYSYVKSAGCLDFGPTVGVGFERRTPRREMVRQVLNATSGLGFGDVAEEVGRALVARRFDTIVGESEVVVIRGSSVGDDGRGEKWFDLRLFQYDAELQWQAREGYDASNRQARSEP